MERSPATRLGALLVAVALVVAAFAWRNRDDGVSISASRDKSDRVVVCIPELASVCESVSEKGIRVTVEPPSVTFERLSKATDQNSASMHGWIATPSWIEAVRDERSRSALSPLLGQSSSIAARTPLVLVADTSRAATLQSACAPALTWKCLGDNMGKAQWSAISGGNASWGALKVGWLDPRTSATGLATLGAHAASYFGRTDIDALDVDSGPFTSWIAAGSRSIPPASGGDPLTSLLTAGPAAYGWVITTEAQAKSALSTAARSSQLRILQPVPAVNIDVVATGVRGSGAASDVLSNQTMKDGLRRGNWSLPAKGTNFGSDGLPNAGTMQSLRTMWQQEITR